MLIPRIVQGMPAEKYHEHSALGSSKLVYAKHTGLKFWAKFLDPDREPDEPTAKMQFGTDLHTYLLEPEMLDARLKILPDDAPNRPTEKQLNAKKPSDDTILAIKFWSELEKKWPGVSIVKPEYMEKIRRAGNRTRKKDTYKMFFESGKPEVSMFWTDPVTGIDCKIRVDWLSGFPAIVDLKTTRDASTGSELFELDENEIVRGGFAWECEKLDYAIKAAHYQAGVQACMGERLPFVFGAIENEEPFDSAFYVAHEEFLSFGASMRGILMERIKTWTDSGHFPGYPDRVSTLGRPKGKNV